MSQLSFTGRMWHVATKQPRFLPFPARLNTSHGNFKQMGMPAICSVVTALWNPPPLISGHGLPVHSLFQPHQTSNNSLRDFWGFPVFKPSVKSGPRICDLWLHRQCLCLLLLSLKATAVESCKREFVLVQASVLDWCTTPFLPSCKSWNGPCWNTDCVHSTTSGVGYLKCRPCGWKRRCTPIEVQRINILGFWTSTHWVANLKEKKKANYSNVVILWTSYVQYSAILDLSGSSFHWAEQH